MEKIGSMKTDNKDKEELGKWSSPSKILLVLIIFESESVEILINFNQWLSFCFLISKKW